MVEGDTLVVEGDTLVVEGDTLVVEGDTLVVTHIDRLSRGLTYGLQVIEGLHHAGVEFRSLVEDFDTSTSTGKLQLSVVLAFSEWWRNSIRERSVAGQAKARTEGCFPGRRPSLTEQQREYVRSERSRGGESAGTGQAPGGQPLDHPTGRQVGVKGVDKTYQWGGAKVYHQRGHWPA